MSERKCRHLWQPYADAERIWQVCVRCGIAEHVTTHAEQTMRTLAYVLSEPENDEAPRD